MHVLSVVSHIVPPVAIIGMWIFIPLLRVILLFCCCLLCFSIVAHWNSSVFCNVSRLSTSVTNVLCLFSFVSLSFAFVHLMWWLSFCSKGIALSNWTFSIVVTFVSFSFALVSSVALSFALAFTFVFSFSFVSFAVAFDCWDVHCCCSSAKICAYTWWCPLFQLVECSFCSVVFPNRCSHVFVGWWLSR